ncbi:ATP-binding protein [Ammoniphilus sp. CFH 90114]|uniref:ATP-binding protein n=1 Tax=Ammoniphilus sp. CFH 90114 TaxID=2493665 RepID=UPI001F0BBEF3|nr:ATP-binding protein [Ammoniphilus sp. CFH 90114]
MVWNSVVGKLWITIIGLVAVVLTLLSLLLVQFLDQFYYQGSSDNLKKLAIQMSTIIEEHPDAEHVDTGRDLIEAFNMNMIVLGVEQVVPAVEKETLPHVPPALLLENEQLLKAMKGEVIVVRDRFPVRSAGSDDIHMADILAVSVPLNIKDHPTGAVILYQTLEELTETTKETTKYILYAAAIGIFLATIFAFFLSTRITQPLRQMRKAADSFAEGDFTTEIQIRSNDEIGDLASTFNHMAKQLDDLIHALSREKEQLSSVLRSMIDGVITVDIEGRIILANPPAESMFKALAFEHSLSEWLEAENLIGMKIPDPLSSFSRNVMEEQHESVTDVTVQGRTLSIIMAPLYDRNQVRGAVAVLRDVTKERQLDKLRKDFVANVSHELRTPLAMLQGYSEAIVDDIAGDPEETKELAQIIHDESVRMSRLVNDLLDLGRMDAGFIELNKETVQLVPMLDKIVRKFTVVGKERNISVRSELDFPYTDEFLLDLDRMEQVFTNLIDNAVRHTEAGGKVTLFATMKEQSLYMEVRDTGSGIPEADLPFVFERFYKADKARTRGRSGTGLGLSIVKQIVLAHGGQIAVHSKLGEGTTFSIHIPRD